MGQNKVHVTLVSVHEIVTMTTNTVSTKRTWGGVNQRFL